MKKSPRASAPIKITLSSIEYNIILRVSNLVVTVKGRSMIIDYREELLRKEISGKKGEDYHAAIFQETLEISGIAGITHSVNKD